jgi:uncharacterized membrane protein
MNRSRLKNDKKSEDIMEEQNVTVGTFDSHAEAEAAIRELHKSNFNMQKLSIIGKDFHTEEHVAGYYNTGDRVKFWGKLGAFWGGLFGLLFGSAFLVIPGIGQVLVFGPLVSWIIGALEGALVAGGLSAFGAALYSVGIPNDSIIKYEDAIKANKFLVIAHGTAKDAEFAKQILDAANAQEVTVHKMNN